MPELNVAPDLRYKIAIGLIPKIGPVLTRRLIAYCGSAEGVFKEKQAHLSKIPGIADRIAKLVKKSVHLDVADAEIEFITKHKIAAYFYLDDNYPLRLTHCEDAPVILYMKGFVEFNRKKVISIVGTRMPTDYGKSMTRELVEQLAIAHPDVLIVSGLAYGIDVCAHKASLKHNLDTVGVLGHGLSTIYPASHRDIAREIAEKGGLLTEFLHNAKPDAPNFVKRNRIVAGMADATVVVESGPEGGALITADIANSYNRDVFAFPGKVNDRMSSGCNKLIKTNRAALAESMEDICYILDWKKSEPGVPVQKELFQQMSDEEKHIAGFLKNEKCATIDILAIRCDMPVSKISASLLSMEFKGMVKCLPGRVYQLL